ncbi:MAG: hypothetical protein JWL67_230 [Solirubrobacterales bacterium]|nr:hypothetical protein [Solirubrobacterales bacterium]
MAHTEGLMVDAVRCLPASTGDAYLTVSVPYMPAGRWPGTSQKNV